MAPIDIKKILAVSLFLFCMGSVLAFVSSNTSDFHPDEEGRPNILIFLADDMTYHDVDNDQISTPNLDQLGAQGMSFGKIFNSAPMCAPTRMSLYTGIHPVRNGAYPNHSKVYPGIQSMPHYLDNLGYHTALIGKRHEAPKEIFPFEFLGGRHHDNGEGIDLDLDKVKIFMEENKGNPWSLVVASNQPHMPWNRGTNYTYEPEELALPPYLIDTPETREFLTRYYAEISYLDDQVGTVMQHLRETGQAENTVVIFLSEQGSNFPHSKWTGYDTGVRSAGIVRWPEMVPENSSSDAIVEYVDVLPTILEAAGGDPAKHDFDGESFLPVLKGEKKQHNDYAFSIQTSKGIYNGPEAYGIRTVRSDNFRLVWNVNHENEFQNLVTGRFMPYKSWEEKGKEGDPFAEKRANWYRDRPEFELYDLRVDPYELHSVADDPAYESVREQLKTELKEWMEQQGDKGAETERNALKRQSDRWMN